MPLVGDNEDVGATTTVGRVKENARRIEPALLVVEEAGFIKLCISHFSEFEDRSDRCTCSVLSRVLNVQLCRSGKLFLAAKNLPPPACQAMGTNRGGFNESKDQSMEIEPGVQSIIIGIIIGFVFARAGSLEERLARGGLTLAALVMAYVVYVEGFLELERELLDILGGVFAKPPLLLGLVAGLLLGSPQEDSRD